MRSPKQYLRRCALSAPLRSPSAGARPPRGASVFKVHRSPRGIAPDAALSDMRFSMFVFQNLSTCVVFSLYSNARLRSAGLTKREHDR